MFRKNSLIFVALLSLLLILASCAPTAQVTSSGGPSISEAQAVPYDGPRARIAVSRFDDKSARGYHQIGDGMAEMLATALFNSNRFIVLERSQLSDVLQEQDLATAGRIKQETAAPTGEIEGAELLVTGAITEFEPGASGVGGGALLPGLPLGLGGLVKKAHVALDIRVVDTKTSRIVSAISVEGSATTVGGGAGTVIGGGRSTLGVGLGGFSKTPMEKAIRLCIQNAVNEISNRTPPNYYRH